MTPEELDKARAKEAWRMWEKVKPSLSEDNDVALFAARLARENWTPPEPVDPDLLAFREWAAKDWAELYPAEVDDVQRGKRDGCNIAKAYLAGARMAAERERERAKVLVEYLEEDRGIPEHARRLAKYRGEA